MTEREPITHISNDLLDGFKRHIRMTSHDLDADLLEKLMAAVTAAEHHIGKVILQSRITTEVDFASSFALKVPVIEVEGLEVDGQAVTDYTVSGNVLTIGAGVTGGTMKVTYKAGLLQIPFDMKAAIFMHAATLFNNPADSVETLAKASRNLLRPYRSWGLDHGEQD